MAETLLTMCNLECAALTFNAVLLLVLGLAMLFAKHLKSFGTNFVRKTNPVMSSSRGTVTARMRQSSATNTGVVIG